MTAFLYRVLLVLCMPGRLRRAFGHDMVRMFEEQLAETRRSHGSVAGLIGAAVADAFVEGTDERLVILAMLTVTTGQARQDREEQQQTWCGREPRGAKQFAHVSLCPRLSSIREPILTDERCPRDPGDQRDGRDGNPSARDQNGERGSASMRWNRIILPGGTAEGRAIAITSPSRPAS